MAKQKQPREWSENGCTFTLERSWRDGDGARTYHVRLPHPFQGWSSPEDTRTSDPDAARAFAVAQMERDRQLATLIDEEAVEREFEAQTRILDRVWGYYNPDVEKSVIETWQGTLQSFGIDPLSAVQVVPVKFETSELARRRFQDGPIAYWTGRKKAADITAGREREAFERLASDWHEKVFYGTGSATCDETTSWGSSFAKGVIETAWQLAVVRKSVDQLAHTFIGGSCFEYMFEFWLEDDRSSMGHSPRVHHGTNRFLVDRELERIVELRAGLRASGARYHQRTTRVFPTIRFSNYEQRMADHRLGYWHDKHMIQVGSLSELIEFFAVLHSRIIAQNVVLLFVDENHPDPDLGEDATENERTETTDGTGDDVATVEPAPPKSGDRFPDERRRLEIKQRMFKALKEQLTPVQLQQRLRKAKRQNTPQAAPVAAPKGALSPDASAEPVPTVSTGSASLTPSSTPRAALPKREIERASGAVQPMAKTYSYLEKLKARQTPERAGTASTKGNRAARKPHRSPQAEMLEPPVPDPERPFRAAIRAEGRPDSYVGDFATPDKALEALNAAIATRPDGKPQIVQLLSVSEHGSAWNIVYPALPPEIRKALGERQLRALAEILREIEEPKDPTS